MDVNSLIEEVSNKSEKSKEEVNKLVDEKLNQLSGLVSKEGAIYIVANELGVKLDIETKHDNQNLELKKIEEIKEANQQVSLVCKIIRKYDLTTFSSKNGGEGSVRSLLVGDETGIMRVVFWNDKTSLLETMNEGDILKITQGYSRENNQIKGRFEVHFSQYSNIEVNPQGVEVEVKPMENEPTDAVKKKISEIETNERNIQIDATIIGFEIPRYYFGCPECFKKVINEEEKYSCSVHGEVQSIKIPIVNLIVDDTTGKISIVGFRDRAEEITKLNSEQIIELSDDIEKYNDFLNKIVGSKISFVGNVSINNRTGEFQILINRLLDLEFKDNIQEENLNKQTNKEPTDEEVNTSLDDDIEEIDIDEDLI